MYKAKISKNISQPRSMLGKQILFRNLWNRIKSNLLRLISIPLFLVAWEVAAHFVASYYPPDRAVIIMPPLEYIFTNEYPKIANFYGVGLGSPQLGHEESYWIATVVLAQNTVITLQRLLVGTLSGAASGIGIGLLISFSPQFRALVETPINVIRTVPMLAWTPLFWLWFGGKSIGQILFIWFAIFLLMVINTINAIDNFPPIYKRFASTLGATKLQLFKTVIIPGIIPELSGAMRVIIGISWAITLGGEYLGAQSGLGFILLRSSLFLFTGKMLVIVFLFMLYSILLNSVFLRIHRYVTRWVP